MSEERTERKMIILNKRFYYQFADGSLKQITRKWQDNSSSFGASVSGAEKNRKRRQK